MKPPYFFGAASQKTAADQILPSLRNIRADLIRAGFDFPPD
jgi:hypothetical protein